MEFTSFRTPCFSGGEEWESPVSVIHEWCLRRAIQKMPEWYNVFGILASSLWHGSRGVWGSSSAFDARWATFRRQAGISMERPMFSRSLCLYCSSFFYRYWQHASDLSPWPRHEAQHASSPPHVSSQREKRKSLPAADEGEHRWWLGNTKRRNCKTYCAYFLVFICI